jgi:hypothetical protein
VNTDLTTKVFLAKRAQSSRVFKNRYIFKADIEYPFEHGEVINSTLDGVSIYLVTTKT